jgi:hypothetical protein
VFIGARGVARAMLTEMNGPELHRIRSDIDAEYIYSHLIDYYKKSLYGGWIYHKQGLRKKNADAHWSENRKTLHSTQNSYYPKTL